MHGGSSGVLPRFPASPSSLVPSEVRAGPAGPRPPAQLVPSAGAREAGSTNGDQTVTFNQEGLVIGTQWFVVITNVGTAYSNASYLTVSLPVGAYNWTASNVEGYAAPSGGTFTVGNAAVWVTVAYHGIGFTTYPVTFASPGLPPTTFWEVTLRTGQVAYSNNSTITFYETNGSFAWSVGALLHLTPSPGSGLIDMNGSGIRERIFWTLNPGFYEVLFTETGLPYGVNWSVTLNHTSRFAYAGPIGFVVPNGSYPFTVQNPFTFTGQPGSGTAVVRGNASEYLIDFNSILVEEYTVSFIGEGLPPVAPWTITLANITLLGGGAASGMSFIVPNGTYSFLVDPPPQYRVAPANGTILVHGADPPLTTLAFTELGPPEYPVTFVETGLTSGASWTVNWQGGPIYPSTSDRIQFDSANGTFDWYIGTSANETASPASGTTVVDGSSPAPMTVAFAPPAERFAVLFRENGLSSGTLWSVRLVGGPSYASNDSTLGFEEPNGSYWFIFGNVSGRSADPREGNFTIDGAPVTIGVQWNPVVAPFYDSPYFWTALVLGIAASVTAVELYRRYRPPRRRISRRVARRLHGEFGG